MEQKVEDVRQKLEEKTQGFDFSSSKLALSVVFLVLVALIGVSQLDMNFSDKTVPEDNTTEEVEQTKYQRVYVDCPPEYLDFCTRMSKIPTEKVSFNRVDNGRIYLDLEEGGTLVARLPTEDSKGYLISINRPS